MPDVQVPIAYSLTFFDGGWVRYVRREQAANVFVRFRLEGERLVPAEVAIATERRGGVSTVMVRQADVHRIVNLVNSDPDDVRRVRAKLRIPGPNWSVTGFPIVRDGSVTLVVPDIPSAVLPVGPDGRTGRGNSYSDEFYKGVAEVYRQLLPMVRSADGRIADENHVSLSQVKRWIRVAREKGFLPSRSTEKG